MSASPLEGIRHVVWDWNGTLLDDAWLCVEVMNRCLARRNLPALDPARYQDVFGFPVRDYYAKVGFDFSRESFEVVGTEFIDGYQARQHECGLRPGAAAALARVAGAGLSQSVLSASQQGRLESQADQLGVRRFFSELLGLSDHYAGGKLETGRRWMATLAVKPEQVLLVGDTDHDAEVARAIGARCVLVPSGHQSSERLRGCGVPILPTLEALAG